MSAIEDLNDEDLPATTVKNRSGYADTLHRQDPEADEPLPACEEKDRPDAEFRQVGTRHHLLFNDLCRNGRCSGEELIADGGQDLVEVCPECDETTFHVKSARNGGPTRGEEGRYWCHCGHHFDDPHERPRKSAAHPVGGLAKRLADADPDDLVTDGGSELAVDDVDVAAGDGELLLGAELEDIRIAIAAPRTTDAETVAATLEAARPRRRSRRLAPGASSRRGVSRESRAASEPPRIRVGVVVGATASVRLGGAVRSYHGTKPRRPAAGLPAPVT